MWKCGWCERTFEEPGHKEQYGNDIAICPFCGEEEIFILDRTEDCACCGREVEELDMQDVCEDCASELWRIWDEAVKGAMTLNDSWDYTEAEDFLKDYFTSLWRDE